MHQQPHVEGELFRTRKATTEKQAFIDFPEWPEWNVSASTKENKKYLRRLLLRRLRDVTVAVVEHTGPGRASAVNQLQPAESMCSFEATRSWAWNKISRNRNRQKFTDGTSI